MHRLQAILLSCLLGLSVASARPVVLLFDNDVHGNLEGYAYLAALRDSLQAKHHHVLTLSCGDFLTGDVGCAISQGAWPVELLEAIGYDWITLGNHEFDYGVERMEALLAPLENRILCCNYLTLPDSVPVYAGYAVGQYGRLRIGFVGVTTPSVAHHTSPRYFENRPLSFGGNATTQLVQQCVDSAKAHGADKVVVLSHLGDRSDTILTSRQLIACTEGMDVLLDGHDHHAIEQEFLSNRRGKRVLLTSTGAHFQAIGLVKIGRCGSTRSQLVQIPSIRPSNPPIDSLLTNYRLRLDSLDAQAVYRHPLGKLAYEEPAIRMQETSIGNFCADALRYGTHADVAIVNAGSIRAGLPSGEARLSDCYRIHPFDNRVSVIALSGNGLLRVLEKSVLRLPIPSGGFLHVSGLRMEVDLSAQQRIRQVEVWNEAAQSYQPLDLTKVYMVAANDYLLLQNGNGYHFEPYRMIRESFASEVQMLQNYLSSGLPLSSPSSPTTEGRIVIR